MLPVTFNMEKEIMTRFVKFTDPFYDRSVFIDISKVKHVNYDYNGYVKIHGVVVKEDIETVMKMISRYDMVNRLD